jgi:PhnB protein
MYIPPGYGTVTPYYFVKGAEDFIEFLKQAFDAVEVLRSTRPDGQIANAEIRIGTSMLMVSDAVGSVGPMPMAAYIYVENADASMQKAITAGATLHMKVSDMAYGDRQGGVRDANGNIWWISQRLVNEPYS